MEIPECPVLRPTLKQFSNFNEYVDYLDKTYKATYGMVKIIPPPEWRARGGPYKPALESLHVNGPIEQNIFGRAGVYECLHIPKKSMTLSEFKAKIGVFDKITKDLSADEVQKMFWKNVVFSPPLYGADLLNTLMDEKAGSWNLGHLESLLSSALETQIKGVNTPYCYVGSWKTLFCWHKEDLDLSAINYLHKGHSKFWYSLPQKQHYILQKEAKKQFPDRFSKCQQHLRHKTTLINPYLLKRQYPELKITKTEHKQNEFMVVFGGAYHCGFNFGFNIAEAVNYGTLDWLRQVIDARSCKCSQSAVRAESIELYRNLSKGKYAKTPEFIAFANKLFSSPSQEESDDSTDRKGLKTYYSKKIRKNGKQKTAASKKIAFKGEQYDIEQWAQCRACRIWRKTLKKYGPNETFVCEQIGKQCHQTEKISKNYITL